MDEKQSCDRFHDAYRLLIILADYYGVTPDYLVGRSD
jgi:hypothetical protein